MYLLYCNMIKIYNQKNLKEVPLWIDIVATTNSRLLSQIPDPGIGDLHMGCSSERPN